MCAQRQLAPTRPGGGGEQGPAGGGGHRPAHVQPGLTLTVDPAGGQRRRRRRGRRREEREEQEEKGRRRVTCAPSLPCRKTMGSDYKTMVLFKRDLFFLSCVVEAR